MTRHQYQENIDFPKASVNQYFYFIVSRGENSSTMIAFRKAELIHGPSFSAKAIHHRIPKLNISMFWELQPINWKGKYSSEKSEFTIYL